VLWPERAWLVRLPVHEAEKPGLRGEVGDVEAVSHQATHEPGAGAACERGRAVRGALLGVVDAQLLQRDQVEGLTRNEAIGIVHDHGGERHARGVTAK